MNENSSAVDVPVLVVGAGPTGLMMASELARHGICCRIIDKAPRPSQLSKALAIHARTLEVFESIGIVDSFVAAGVKAHGGSIYANRKRIVHFLFDRLESRYNYALMLPQDETEVLLSRHLESLGVKVERSVELCAIRQDADSVTATLRLADGGEERCRAEYLVGCDGAHSTVRHALNIGFLGAEYEENFALADIKVDSNLPDDEIVGFAGDKGIVFFFPITHGRYRIIADVVATGSEDPTLEELQKIVDEQCHIEARLHDPKWTAYFKIHRRQAVAYRMGRAFLAGDAAHIHSPAGGQGMNTGLQDAYNLAWKLAATLQGRVTPAVLDSYAAERHAVGRQVLTTTDAMTRMMELRNPIAAHIRNRLASALSSLEVFQSLARRNMSELAVNYRDSPIVAEYREGVFGTFAALGGGPHAGDRAPDADGLLLPDGSKARLFELLRGDHHTLLLFGAPRFDSSESANSLSIARQVYERYSRDVIIYLVGTGDGVVKIPDWNGGFIVDRDSALHRAYHAAAPCAYLIRPDGYIGYRSFPAESTHLLEFLGRIFTLNE
jgi:2-polyprenyl-6-methoxyphenol hydroxylase-like FAD-dependent oxidoreductase